jgi:DNA mismatch repair protein MSH5
MNAAQASMPDWQALYKCAYNGIYIGDICSSQPKSIHIFNRIASEFSEDLHRIASLITKVVDFEESSVQQRFCVKSHVDEELDKLKELYNGLPDLLTRVAHEELEKLPGIAECNVTYLPQAT